MTSHVNLPTLMQVGVLGLVYELSCIDLVNPLHFKGSFLGFELYLNPCESGEEGVFKPYTPCRRFFGPLTTAGVKVVITIASLGQVEVLGLVDELSWV